MTHKTTNKPATSLDDFCTAKLATLEAKNARRILVPTTRQPQAKAQRGEADYISFSCNDYLGLSHHPETIAAAQTAVQKYGTSAGASRLVTGNVPLFAALEKKLAALKNTQDSLIFGSGYLANIGTIPALVGAGDLVLVDALAHACIQSGARLSGAQIIHFNHNNMSDLENHLKTRRADFNNCLIITDGVFSMDGDLAPLPALRRLADAHTAWLMVDDAHGLGVVGGGRGASHAFDPPIHADIQMGTLSKAIGSYGGYICASHAVCELLRNRARPMVFSTGLPPASIAASLAALTLIEKDPALCAAPVQKATLFCDALNLPAPASPIVPVILKTNQAALAAAQSLAEKGFMVVAIRPPSVPENTARLRIAFNATHKDKDVARLAEAVKIILEQNND